MLKAAWELLRDSGRILLEAAPEDMNLDDVLAHLLGTEHVQGVHDLHAWTVTAGLPALSAHIVVDDSCFTSAPPPRRAAGVHRRAPRRRALHLPA